MSGWSGGISRAGAFLGIGPSFTRNSELRPTLAWLLRGRKGTPSRFVPAPLAFAYDLNYFMQLHASCCAAWGRSPPTALATTLRRAVKGTTPVPTTLREGLEPAAQDESATHHSAPLRSKMGAGSV